MPTENHASPNIEVDVINDPVTSSTVVTTIESSNVDGESERIDRNTNTMNVPEHCC